MARIFISHSSRDNDAADRMKAWLGSQGFEKAFLDKDKVTGIPPGADWEKTLYRQVELSQAVIILQTRNWLDSKWCFAEFTQARALGKPIFPVIEIPANGARIAPDIQALDLTSNRVDGLERLKLELVRIARDVGGGYDWDPRRSPFPGLHAFQEEDAAVYFGRGDEIRGLIERLEARRAQGGAKLIALLGSSGSGKSSLLRAGLVPRLKGGGHNWIVIQPIRPGERPVDALAVTLAAAQGLDGNWRKLRDELVGSEPEHALADLANDLRVKNGAPEAQILLTIDQTEELFGVTDPDETRRFLEIVSRTLSESLPFLAMMVLRSDFLGQLQSAASLTARFEEFSLGPIPLARIPQIIKGPARVAGLSIDETFVQQAIHDAETEDALPLLAFALRELLDQSSNKALTLDGYKSLGDEKARLTPLENAVRQAADRVLAEAKPTDDELTALREAFVPAMVRVNDEGQYVRRPAQWDGLPKKSHPLLERLAEARLLVVRPDGEARVVEAAHEALLRKWPLLSSWLDDEREFLIGKQQLEQDVRDWDQASDADKAGTLLTGLKLTRARGWLLDHPMRLTAQEREFIRVSAEHVDSHLKAERNAALERQTLLKAATTVLVEVQADKPRVPFVSVSAGESWIFYASGRWKNGFFSCGPDGLRNFLFDALASEPVSTGYRWLQLLGEVEGQAGSTFPIGTGCTKTFTTGGELIVFANTTVDSYPDNRGSIQLRGRMGDAPPVLHRSAIDLLLDVFARTRGISLVALVVIGVSGILLLTPQGHDVVRGVGEDRLGFSAIAFAIGLLFFGIQVWSWSRIVIAFNYGTDRMLWRPRWFLEWGPRVLAFLPFAAAALALTISFKWNAPLAWGLLALGVLFLMLGVARRPVTRLLLGNARASPWVQRAWVVGGFISGLCAIVVAVLCPVGISVALGAPAIVFIGLGFIIPVITIASQLGASLRIPVVGALLFWAVLMGAFFDNHRVGRRALIAETGGSTVRPTLESAFKQWASQQPVGSDGRKTMVLIAVQGGAARAGYWAAVVLAKLHEAVAAAKIIGTNGQPVDLGQRVFAIISVSGGSVGSVGYAAMLKSARNDKNFRNDLLGFAGRDVLGPALTGMLYSDLLYRFLPLWVLPDRAETLERASEEAWDAPDDSTGSYPRTTGTIGASFLALGPKDGEPWRPLLIIQGASESNGRRMLTSAVKFTCNEVDADDLLDGIRHDVAASTAILSGARLPWVSPAGTFLNRPCYGKEGDQEATDHVLDGGYFDSVGGETLREMTRAIRSLPGGQEKDLNIAFIVIAYARPRTVLITGLEAWVSNHIAALAPNDVFAPILGLYNGMGAHAEHLAREMKLSSQPDLVDPGPLESRLMGNSPYAALILCPGEVKLEGGRTISYDPPMDWTLSGEAKRYIEDSVIATSPACNAKRNAATIHAIVDWLKR